MSDSRGSRREFLKMAGMVAGTGLVSHSKLPASAKPQTAERPDYTLRIAASPIEIGHKQIVSGITYNGQFPGPLLRFKEGQPVTIEIHNETDTPEQLHWHGQVVPTDVDGAAEEGTPFIPAHGMRRITFTPGPSGFRFYHTHNRAGADLHAGQYSGQVGPVYIEPKREPGSYDKEVFLVLKEFEPSFSQGGDMAQHFLPDAKVKELEAAGESSMKASLAKGMPHGYEVGYRYFTINGRMLGHGEPVRVKRGERVLFHVLNGSATEIRSLALPGHTFKVVALDGNAVPVPAEVPVLWLGTAERISAIVEMNHPGTWVMGDVADDDRGHGMGIVVEYAGHKGKAGLAAAEAISLELRAIWQSRLACVVARRDVRYDVREGECCRRRIQSLDDQWIGLSDVARNRARVLSPEAGEALSAADAQRERRHTSDPSAPPQL